MYAIDVPFHFFSTDHPLTKFIIDLQNRYKSWNVSWEELKGLLNKLDGNWQANVNPSIPPHIPNQQRHHDKLDQLKQHMELVKQFIDQTALDLFSLLHSAKPYYHHFEYDMNSDNKLRFRTSSSFQKQLVQKLWNTRRLTLLILATIEDIQGRSLIKG
ncbi:hypothetical protein D915_003833 [Fasciola hepatica]|uniref:Uncharacterized protein n=1 Tax=Fasciola hepatica TaxID=6192 RepID=A0A4E0RZX8_FASHE|nr:hypothetical protein D915_003833 [Fasciola hepatica]